MDFNEFTFSKKYLRNDEQLSLFFDFDLQDLTNHNRKTFDDCQSLLFFLQNNLEKQIYLTRTKVSDFYEEDNKLVINIESYQEFCKKIGQNGKNRTQAFLSKNVDHYTEDQKKEIIAGSTEEEIIERIKNFTNEQKNIFIEKLKEIDNINFNKTDIENISNDDFLKAFSLILNDPKKQEIIIENYPQVQINVLEEHKKFLENNLDKKELYIQNWIDGNIDNNGIDTTNISEEDKNRLQKSRLLIFGLEFTGHEREVLDSGQRMDILARINLENNKKEYTLFELKSPCAPIFVDEDKEIKLSPRISRAIPQVLDYKADFEEKKDGDADLNRKKILSGKITKCIIIIGKQSDNERNKKIFRSLKENFSNLIEIWTYTDLINRLETTIKNLRENL